MDIGKAFVDSVIIGDRHRELDEAKVDTLAESMTALGLQQPVSIYVDDADAAHLVAGRHRLEAARKLGWEEIDCIFVTLSPVRREMWEIAENLFRVDLTKEQRDEHIRRYAELLTKAAEEEAAATERRTSLQDGRKAGPQHQKGIASKVADETGLNVRTVQRVLNPTPPKPKEVMSDEDVIGQQFARLVGAWNGAGPEARQQFREWIDEPLMDERHGIALVGG